LYDSIKLVTMIEEISLLLRIDLLERRWISCKVYPSICCISLFSYNHLLLYCSYELYLETL